MPTYRGNAPLHTAGYVDGIRTVPATVATPFPAQVIERGWERDAFSRIRVVDAAKTALAQIT